MEQRPTYRAGFALDITLGGTRRRIMTFASPYSFVEQFNECINAGDLNGLGALMTADHTFTDTAGCAVSGKTAVTSAWSGFFSAFPGYRNEFERHRETQDVVAIQGRSLCTDPRLSGPALWRARVRGAKISEWQVYADTAENRVILGL
jgi:ketosteroid isomerase-like protein